MPLVDTTPGETVPRVVPLLSTAELLFTPSERGLDEDIGSRWIKGINVHIVSGDPSKFCTFLNVSLHGIFLLIWPLYS